MPDSHLLFQAHGEAVSLQIQRATSLGDWLDYAEAPATGTLQSARLFDPDLPADEKFIPAGRFMMGSATNSGYEAYCNELPQHAVFLEACAMDSCEVSKARWDSVAEWGSLHGYDLTLDDGFGIASDHPVVSVSWHEAVKWCNARSERAGLTPCYSVAGETYRSGVSDLAQCDWSASGYRLPTEAEWEKAARGGVSGKRFPWVDSDEIKHLEANYYSYSGYSYDTSTTRSFNPACTGASTPYTAPIGHFPANAYGLHDMAGNVWEWCWDGYSASYYTNGIVASPTGEGCSSTRSVRGGSWCSGADSLRVAARCGMAPTTSNTSVGFRCVRRLASP